MTRLVLDDKFFLVTAERTGVVAMGVLIGDLMASSDEGCGPGWGGGGGFAEEIVADWGEASA
jgi:hypothetical protein